MGRTNSKDNLIYLYAQEHYYAHKLLAKENPSEKKLQFAWWNMCQCISEKREGCRISEEDYAEARITAAKANSDIKKGKPLSKEHKEKLKGRGKPVINLTTGKTYVSAYSASEETGVLASHIGDCCNGRAARAGQSEDGIPYIWRFVGEENIEFQKKDIFIQRKIKCVETEVIYESIRDAYRDTGVARTTIKTDCENSTPRKSKNRKHFCYV